MRDDLSMADTDTDARPLRRLNLNLLYALDAILRAPTLTAAGRRVSLSQPAMSMALRRLRDHFQDDLVVYRAGDRRLTALGEALAPRIGRVLREAGEAFDLSLDFDPATARRSITLAAPEAVELMFLSRVIPDILRAGPDLDVRLAPFDHTSVSRMFDHGVDVAIVPETMIEPGSPSLPLFDHRLVGMVWVDRPCPGKCMSLADYLGGRHAALLEDMEQVSSYAQAAEPPMSERRVVVRTGRYAMLPSLVIGTDLIVTTSDWLAQHFASILPVKLVTLPMVPRPMRMAAVWASHRTNEPMIRWLLDRIVTRSDWLLPRPDRHPSD